MWAKFQYFSFNKLLPLVAVIGKLILSIQKPFGRKSHDRLDVQKIMEHIDSFECHEVFAANEKLSFEFFKDLAIRLKIEPEKPVIELDYAPRLCLEVTKFCLSTNVKHLTCLEIGTARGFSAILVAAAIEEAGRIATVLTVDRVGHLKRVYRMVNSQEGASMSRSELVAPFVKSLTSKFLFFQSSSSVLDGILESGNIDFAFVDGDHSYLGVKRDIEFLSRRLSDRFLVIFDDYDEYKFPGLKKAVDNWVRTESYSFEAIIVGSKTLGVVKS